jgi:Cys-tRNA synthase (O-phospho-L-seryl-tRNA:Cys-tRNA synthase)
MDYSSLENKFDEIFTENKRKFFFLYKLKKRGGFGEKKKEHFFYIY